ncbi:ubiquitin-like-conjugating enzyme ATG10 [Elysia marginata]|uniref:Ubiquitin-like-conjugating enzyme ATG10 n=1 Tax=Elysia marginata TaxID=1093978 RepID=A0AAV4HRR5_9GAST|nr:ubiquitin-like-conjugating enzyme ATG10 [Elysia marginata]
MGTGLLSRAEFERQVERFVDISTKINDEWQLVRANNGILYMVKKFVLRSPENFKSPDISPDVLNSQHSTAAYSAEISDGSSAAMSSNLATPAAGGSSRSHLYLQSETPIESSPPLPKTSPSRLTKTLASESLSDHVIAHSPEKQSVFGNSSIQNEPLLAKLPNQSVQAPTSSEDIWVTNLSKDLDRFRFQNEQSQQYLMQQPSTSKMDTHPVLGDDQLGKTSSSEEKSTQMEASIGSLDRMEMESDTEDESCMPQNWPSHSQQTPLTYEYHVVYSESYSVPVLYFNTFTPDGKLLPLDDVWNLCPEHYQAHIKENKWSTLTQQEHPLLGRPYLQLHPCHTADLMTQMTAGRENEQMRNYLATWLSTVGPLVALKIAPAYIVR